MGEEGAHRSEYADSHPANSTSSSAAYSAPHGAARKTGSRTSVQPGAVKTVDKIIELSSTKNATEALALYRDFYAKEGDELQAILRSARRSGLDFYSSLVQSAVRIGRPEMVEELLDDMTNALIERTLSFYESMMKVLAGKKYYRQALDVYKRMEREGFKASPVTLSCLINFSAELGDLDSAIAFFEELSATSKPSIRAYMVALRVYSKRQDWPNSIDIVRRMQQGSIPVDSLILNTVLATGVAAGKTECAEELLQEMVRDNCDIVDVISCNTILKGYAHQKVADKALKMLDDLLARGIKANGITFNTVMDAAVRGSQIEEAWKVFERMRAAGVRSDKYTCTILMKALHEKSTPKQLSNLVEMIQAALPQCDASLVNSLLHGILQVSARLNNTALLMQTLNQMQTHRIVPTSADYQLMIQTLAGQCDSKNCSIIWRRLLVPVGNASPKEQQSPTAAAVSVFSTVVDNLVQKDHVEAVMCAFESLVATAPFVDHKGSTSSQKGSDNGVPLLLQQCRTALIQAASRKQHTSPAFKRLLELASEQGMPLES